jgi:hypothetical protein
VIPTPADVLPLAEETVPPLQKALSLGIALADELQSDRQTRDPWYWSHTARWVARNHLRSVQSSAWKLLSGVPNSGIHLRIGTVHHVRVLRSLGGTVPHPGRNRARRADWIQDSLLLDEDNQLPALSLLYDWQVLHDEPSIYLSLPKRPWSYREQPELHWRVPVTGDADQDLANLSFDPGLLPGDVVVTVKIDPADEGVG